MFRTDHGVSLMTGIHGIKPLLSNRHAQHELNEFQFIYDRIVMFMSEQFNCEDTPTK